MQQQKKLFPWIGDENSETLLNDYAPEWKVAFRRPHVVCRGVCFNILHKKVNREEMETQKALNEKIA